MFKKLKNTPFLFSFKTWLTCLVLAPIFNCFIFSSIRTAGLSDFFGIFSYSVVIGCLFSLPAFGCLILLTYFLRNKDWDIQLKRGILVVLGSGLAIASFFLLGGGRSLAGIEIIILSYIITLNIGLIFYKFPEKAFVPLSDGEID